MTDYEARAREIIELTETEGWSSDADGIRLMLKAQIMAQLAILEALYALNNNIDEGLTIHGLGRLIR